MVSCSNCNYRAGCVHVDFVDIISTTGHHAGIAKRSNILLVQQLCCHDGTLILVTRKVHRSSFMRLVCYAEEHFIFLTLLILSTPSTPFVFSLTHPDVGAFSVRACVCCACVRGYVCDVEHTFHSGLCGRKFVLCVYMS